jgi:hypothetical protein
VARSDDPKRTYSALIGRLVLGQSIQEAEVDLLPDPEAFRDAFVLAQWGTWTQAALDETDALVLALVQQIRNAGRKKG